MHTLAYGYQNIVSFKKFLSLNTKRSDFYFYSTCQLYVGSYIYHIYFLFPYIKNSV